MIRYILLTVISTSLFISSCKKKEETEDEPYKINYINQTLQGKIDGQAWIFNTGNAQTSSFAPPDFDHNFEFSDSVSTDSCFLNWGRMIFFSFEDKNAVLPTGSKTLSFDFNKDVNYTVTFYFFKDSTSYNKIAVEGGYEIISVDTTNKIITGRMDAFFDKNNFANGNFEIKYCYF